MQRRDLLRLLGGMSALATVPTEELFALGEATHARLRASRSPLGLASSSAIRTKVRAIPNFWLLNARPRSSNEWRSRPISALPIVRRRERRERSRHGKSLK